MDRFPRTAAEFAENGRIVVMRCNCGADSTWIRPENLIQRLGSGFDLYTGFVELLDTFRCDSAGSGGTPPSSTFSSNHSVQSAWRVPNPDGIVAALACTVMLHLHNSAIALMSPAWA